MLSKVKNIKVKKYLYILVICLCSLLFSFWLMFSTFFYRDGNMLISAKAWSDFSGNIPLIRSFSLGNNFPPQYPLFSGEPIRYHYLFYFLVGMLEKVGLRIDWAFNLPSALSFFALMLIIYFLAKNLFRSKAVGVLSLIFFLFNGSFSFLEFFKAHPISLNAIKDIVANTTFLSFGPYDGKIVSAFWNLNIYTNQRHLALPLALLLLIVFIIVKYEERRKNLPLYLIILLGIFVGTLPLSHSSIFIMALAVLGILFLLLNYQKRSLFLILLIGALISLPRVLFLKQTASYIPHLQFGYLITNQLSIFSFFQYWFMNLGLSLILIPIGFAIAPKLAKKILIAFVSLFLIGNLFQFSPEIAGNHKFFNTFLIIGNMYSAFLLVQVWGKLKLFRSAVIIAIFFLTLSGIIDFFPIKNDSFIALSDYPKNPDIQWIMKNTPKDAIFLNTSYLYNPASLAGRKILLGWPYFAWSLGYNTQERSNQIKNFFILRDKKNICIFLQDNKLNYISLENPSEDFPFDPQFWKENFIPLYQNKDKQLIIYGTKNICSSI